MSPCSARTPEVRIPARDVRRSFELVSLSDQRRSEALAARAAGDAATAVAAFADAARHARDAGDVRRFTEAALGAAGDGWRASLDATDDIVMLLEEALEHVPAGPTRLRSRLLARWAIAASHHRPAAECEAAATKALATARAMDEPALIAGALHALCVVVWDPERRSQHWAWTRDLLKLATEHPEEPWRRWALPIVARVQATDGDLAGALETLDELAGEASRCGDTVGAFAASYAGLLRASVAGDWSTARAAAAASREPRMQRSSTLRAVRSRRWACSASSDCSGDRSWRSDRWHRSSGRCPRWSSA